jgi:hypothetical protein
MKTTLLTAICLLLAINDFKEGHTLLATLMFIIIFFGNYVTIRTFIINSTKALNNLLLYLGDDIHWASELRRIRKGK